MLKNIGNEYSWHQIYKNCLILIQIANNLHGINVHAYSEVFGNKRCLPQPCTSVLEAMVKKAGFPARCEGVGKGFLGVRVWQRDTTVILIMRKHLRVATQHTCTQFSWQMAMWRDKPLPDHVLGNHWVIFPRKGGTWSVRRIFGTLCCIL